MKKLFGARLLVTKFLTESLVYPDPVFDLLIKSVNAGDPNHCRLVGQGINSYVTHIADVAKDESKSK